MNNEHTATTIFTLSIVQCLRRLAMFNEALTAHIRFITFFYLYIQPTLGMVRVPFDTNRTQNATTATGMT